MSSEEEELFEEHLLECEQCFSQLKRRKEIIEAINSAAAKGLLDPDKKKQSKNN